MSILYDRITEALINSKKTIYVLEKTIPLTKGSIRKWKNSMPSGDKILKVANYLDISVDYLLGNSDNPQSHKSKEDFSSAAKELSESAAKMTASAAQTEEDIQKILAKYKL